MAHNQMKRTRWRATEIQDMLGIIKEKHIMQLMDSKQKRNKSIFQDIEKQMKIAGYDKTADQIRAKYKLMKAEYLKCKRNNKTSGSQRDKCEHFELLDEMLQNRPLATISGFDTSEECEEFIEITPMYEIDKNATDEDNVGESVIEASSDASLEFLESETGTPNLKTFKSNRKRSYQTAIKSFANDWKETQEEFLNKLKEQEDDLINKLKESDDSNLKALEVILENDRKESAKLFSEIVSALH